jgi:hypothetical protein
MLFGSLIVFGLSLIVAISYGYFYLVIATMPDAFGAHYRIEPAHIGLTYLGIGVGSVANLLFWPCLR